MKTLNLVDLDKSDVKYKISKFPDGQQNIVILGVKPVQYSNPDLFFKLNPDEHKEKQE